MKIKFNGHSATDREVEFSQDDQVRLFEMMFWSNTNDLR